MEHKETYFLYSEDGKEFIGMYIGVQELSVALNRTERGTQILLNKIKNKRNKYIESKGSVVQGKKEIKETKPVKYMLLTERDMNKRMGGKKIVKNTHCKKILQRLFKIV